MGVKAGVADIFIAVPRAPYSGLWIELKAGMGKLSPAQQRFLERMIERGYMAVACWGFENAQHVIKQYLA